MPAMAVLGLVTMFAALCKAEPPTMIGKGTDLEQNVFSMLAQGALNYSNASVTVIADADSAQNALRESIKPQYPEQAKREGIEGYVVVQFDITNTGEVSGARVIEAEPANCFETAAIDAVKQYRFSPNSSTSETVTIRGAVNKFVFSLNDAAPKPRPATIHYRGRTYYALNITQPTGYTAN